KINVMLKTALYNNEEYMSLIIPDVSKDINSFIQFKDTKRNDIDMMENSVMVTNDFAAKQGIKEGSVISIEFQGIESEFMVTAVIDYYFGDVVYISSGLIASNYSLEYNAIYVTTGLKMDAEKDALRDELKNDENVINVSFKEDIKYSFNKTSESMNGIIVVLILFACALAIIINYNISLINIVSRNREIATLKVLGYQEIEVTGYMFRESAIISTISILVGLGLGRLLHFSIISSIIIDGVRLSNQVDWLSYILTLVLAYVFLGFVYLISYPKIKSINMIDALKSFE
ncbi:MAG: ABC transporter permease, partial [Bacilli bacterium]